MRGEAPERRFLHDRLARPGPPGKGMNGECVELDESAVLERQ